MRTRVLLVLCVLAFTATLAQAHEVTAPEVADTTAAQVPADDWYGMLELQGGTTYEFSSRTARPYVAGKLGGYRDLVGIIGTELDVDEETEEKGVVAVLAGATYNLGNLSDYGVELSWAKHLGFNVGLCGTYSFDTNEYGWRGVLSIVDLSFDQGNAEKQRAR